MPKIEINMAIAGVFIACIAIKMMAYLDLNTGFKDVECVISAAVTGLYPAADI
jgi:hypothetical protein